jgi:hypothetical protein
MSDDKRAVNEIKYTVDKIEPEKPKYRSTPIELFLDWLSNQPDLLVKRAVVKRVESLRDVESKGLMRAYQEGYDSYSHPKNYDRSSTDWYRQMYKRVEKIGYRQRKKVIKIYENGKHKPPKSFRKRDLR